MTTIFIFFLWAAVPFFFLLPPLAVSLPLCICSFDCRDKHNNGFQRLLERRDFSMTTRPVAEVRVIRDGCHVY